MHLWAKKFYFQELKFQTYAQNIMTNCGFNVIYNFKKSETT